MLRKSYPSEFNAKVALEALRENQTAAELCSAFGVHTTMITRWKRYVLDQLPCLFSDKIKHKDNDQVELIGSLYQQIGQLKVEVDYLKKKSTQLK